MMNLKNNRREQKAVELICEKLEIDDKQLDDFISGVNAKISKDAIAVKETSNELKDVERKDALGKIEKADTDKVKARLDNLKKARGAKAKAKKEKEKALADKLKATEDAKKAEK